MLSMSILWDWHAIDIYFDIIPSGPFYNVLGL